MLSTQHLSKSFGPRTVLQEINFNLGPGERVGLIGPNGCGKSTLLKILAGIEQPDHGQIKITRPDVHIGYLAQGFDFPTSQTMAEVLSMPVRDGGTDLERLAIALGNHPEDKDLRAEYDALIGRLLGNSFLPPQEPILAALGLSEIPPEQPVGRLSGGQKTRLALARVLIESPNLLLLDEPTNHLDIQMLEWLEAWLERFPGAALIVSHDRAFLDHVVQRILEIDPVKHVLHAYEGSYSDYLEQKLAEEYSQSQEYADWENEVSRLRRAATHVRSLTVMRKGGKADGGDKFAKGFFGGRATGRVAKRAKVIEERLEQLVNEGRVEKPRASWQMKLELGVPAHLGREVISMEDLTLGYPGQPALLEGVTAELRGGQHAVLTGPNGCGKTSLLRAITGDLSPISGSLRLGTNVRLGIMNQEQVFPDLGQSALRMVQQVVPWNQTDVRTFLHQFLFTGDDPLLPAAQLSYGGRARLQLALLVAQGCNFLLLDEPINHLDIPSRESFEKGLAQFQGTVLAVAHDRYFIDRFASVVWLIEEHKIRTIYTQ
jgi:ATP-binding cassette subfamily F protein 3